MTLGKGRLHIVVTSMQSIRQFWLVAAFVDSHSPKLPIDCFSNIGEIIFAEVTQLKGTACESFKVGDLDSAMATYLLALEKFAKKMGSNGPQRDCYVALLSNVSLIYYKKEEYLQSEAFASKVLDIEWGHEKCSYRRAMARLKNSQSKPQGNVALL